MASAWGSSWGVAWGNSWGATAVVTQPATRPTGGTGKEKIKKPKQNRPIFYEPLPDTKFVYPKPDKQAEEAKRVAELPPETPVEFLKIDSEQAARLAEDARIAARLEAADTNLRLILLLAA